MVLEFYFFRGCASPSPFKTKKKKNSTELCIYSYLSDLRSLTALLEKNGVEYIGDAKLNISRPPFTCSKSISETLEQGVKYVRT